MIALTNNDDYQNDGPWSDLARFEPIHHPIRGVFPVRSRSSRTKAQMRSCSRRRRKAETFNGVHRRRNAMKWPLATLVCVAMLASMPAPVLAGPIATFTFGGIVTFANNPGSVDPLWANVAAGDPWEVTYTFDCMTPDTITGPPYGPNGELLGEYAAISSYSLSIGPGGSPPTDSGSVNPNNTFIRVFNNQPASYDQYEVAIPMQTGQWFMELDDSTNSAFATDELPCCGEIPLPLANFFGAAREFQMQGGGFPFGGEIRGSVDYHASICIPEPASLALACLPAVLLLGRRRRRQTRRQPSAIAAGLVCLSITIVALCSARASAQPFPDPVDVGPFRGTLIADFTGPTTRMPLGMTQRCVPIPGRPANDLAQYAFGTANIGTPFQSSTTPLFGAPGLAPFVQFGEPDVLNNPGTHYNSLQLGSPTVNSSGTLNNQIPPPTINAPALSGTRFGGASVTIAPASISGTITDNKLGDTGASFGVVSYEETYDINTGGGISFGGAAAFNVVLPKSIPAIGQIPGAAAFALTTSAVATPGSVVTDLSTGFSYDANCFRMGSIIVSVSEGVADGHDNQNQGLQENYFGNADVGSIVGGSFFDLTGGVTISSTTVNPDFGFPGLDEDYRVAATWETPALQFSNSSGPVKVTFVHTLTMIADPGAAITLSAMTPDEYALLPHGADLYVIASGTAVPEPGACSLACCAAIFLAGSVIRRRKRGSVDHQDSTCVSSEPALQAYFTNQ